MTKIGKVRISNPFVLAPMAGVNCSSFRLFCKQHGAGLVYTQMYDSDLICKKSPANVRSFVNVLKDEKPVSVQFIGSNIRNLTRSAELVEDFADIIDLNFGCILPDFLKKGCGSSLLKNSEKIKKIASAVVGCTNKPVSAKIRIGWDSHSINAVKVSKVLEDCGISAVAVHGRTAEQKYAKKINWSAIKQVKEAINIPVIANGDVVSYDDGLKLLEKTGADLVMIGREARNSPWIFNKDFKSSNKSIKNEIFKFIELYEKHERRISISELRDHVYWMFRDIKTKQNPKDIHKLNSVEEVEEYIKKS